MVLRQIGELHPPLEAVQRVWPNVTDVVRAFDTLAVYFEEAAPSPEAVLDTMLDLSDVAQSDPERHSIPIRYERGIDFPSVCVRLGLNPEAFKSLHSATEFRVEAIGFSPGFPYLSGLPKPLCGLPRLATPRPRVDEGSVAIAEDLCGIYPQSTPGGWTLIGRTPVRLADVSTGYFRFKVGDFVRFVPIEESQFVNWSNP